ncbi:MAG: EamA family transporter [Bacteroidetes bacterium]|nr:EamA family transporter [Bacteroidota bacterium]
MSGVWYNALLWLVTIVWGSTFFIVKDTVATVDEFFLVFTRNALAAIPLAIIALVRYRREMADRKTILYGAVIGFLLATTYIAQTIGLKFTSTGHSAFITGSAVVVVPFLIVWYYREKFDKILILPIILTFVGLFVLTYDFETTVNIGDVITLIVVAAYAHHIVFAGRFVKKVHTFSLITYQFIFSALFSLAGYAFTGFPEIALSESSIWALVYLGTAGTLFCYFVTVWAQTKVSPIKVAIIFAMEPVFAVLFGYFAISETFGPREIAGMLTVLGGVVLYQILEYRRMVNH